MFLSLRSEVDARFQEVRSFFKATRNFHGDLGSAAKGLAFVHIYSVYEYTVRTLIEAVIDSINACNHDMVDLTPSLLAFYLDPEITSLKDSSQAKKWTAREKIFERVFFSKAKLSTSTRPPSDGTHYRHTQLITILNVFGISRPPVRRKRHLYRIDEVVDNRNKIAHGQESASEIGRRYSRDDIIHIITQIKSVCNTLIYLLETFCSDPKMAKRK
ncbi:MAG: MAE_28990/MAE_18760 family HEPN-like nuclease [Negativicutes bacterium]|nr:MAE_28990/MAE_18760 family HEPN-like nuclease [Negativicutes bacterium]